MKTFFNKRESEQFIARYPNIPADLALRVYTSRLIGKDPDLVLHGGGNTSVKVRVKNIIGEEQEVLFIKGSGVDLATIEPGGFAGLELESLQKLRNLQNLADEELENQLQIHKIRFDSPSPSVEALLHAFLPARYVDHTHADAILILTNQKQGKDFLPQALGPNASFLPYIQPGIALAQEVFKRWAEKPGLEAIVVSHHGIFTFGEDAQTSYARMIDYVHRAETFLKKKTTRKALVQSPPRFSGSPNILSAKSRFNQVVRGVCSFKTAEELRRRFYVEIRDAADLRKASLLKEAKDFCRSGVLTPDHVTRTKNSWVFIENIPEDDQILQHHIHKTVDAYKASYDSYFSNRIKAKKVARKEPDSNPRIFLVAGVGIVALGSTRKASRIAADIAEHTLRAKLVVRAMGQYVPLSESHIFDMEYWPLQQKKIGELPPLPLMGQVAVITGAGGAIGLGIADRLLSAGAVVVLSDIDESYLQKVYAVLIKKYDPDLIEKIRMDVTRYEDVEKAFQEISCRVGGIDLLVPNAGIAHAARLEELEPQNFEQVIAVNFKGTFNVIKASIPIFKRQGTGGNIVVISSKNVFDPGAAFGAYSASKAGAHQISKIAALELAELGVRVNLVNPDAVFGDEEVPSKLWETVGPDRMKSRGLDPEGLKEYYRQRNLLKVQVKAEHVGNAVVFFAGEGTPTTGATLPVDGGIPAAFPR